jgi:hypothetical protein
MHILFLAPDVQVMPINVVDEGLPLIEYPALMVQCFWDTHNVEFVQFYGEN